MFGDSRLLQRGLHVSKDISLCKSLPPYLAPWLTIIKFPDSKTSAKLATLSTAPYQRIFIYHLSPNIQRDRAAGPIRMPKKNCDRLFARHMLRYLLHPVHSPCNRRMPLTHSLAFPELPPHKHNISLFHLPLSLNSEHHTAATRAPSINPTLLNNRQYLTSRVN